MPHPRFKRHPRPDPEVVDLLERVLAAARKGYVKTVAIAAVNPLHQVETGVAGDLSHVRTNAVLAGLTRTAIELAAPPKPARTS